MATKASKSTDIAVKDDKNELTMSSMTDIFAADAGAGMENVGKEDTKIPFLRVLQALSPQLQDGDPQYIEGAKAGMIINTVTNELYDGKVGLLMIPCHYEKTYVEWKPRAEGGGFVAQYNEREEAEDKASPENDIIDTALHYGLVYSQQDEVWQPVVLPCKSTMLSVSRGWNAMMQNFILKRADGSMYHPPSFSCIYSITTGRQQNEQGTWYNIVVQRAQVIDDVQLYGMAREFYHTLRKGDVQLAYETLDDSAPSREDEEVPSF